MNRFKINASGSPDTEEKHRAPGEPVVGGGNVRLMWHMESAHFPAALSRALFGLSEKHSDINFYYFN